MTGHVLVAPDKFKGSLTAAEVAAAVADGLGGGARTVPLADGGEGTVEAAVSAGFRRVPVTVHGPAGQPVTAAFAVRDGTAVVELAEASGLQRLPGPPAPLTASSFGTGELIAAAVSAGCRRIVLGVGGSACTDGGAGLLSALGAKLLDRDGGELAPGGAALRDLDRVELTGLHPALAGVEFELAGDVDNPLLGPTGAAAVYGPQKGASPADVAVLEAGLRRWSEVVGPRCAGAPGAGAAGGVGYAALAVLGARRRPGVRALMDLVGFDDALRGARLVVTGEGSLDEQTLHGKTPAGVAGAGRAAGIPVVAVAGRCLLDGEQLAAAGIRAAYALTDLEPDPARCMTDAGPLLRRLAGRLAADWLGRSCA
ncbi:glycerate kinase [Amycolatopsis thermalba]|uniref:Glycerate kinase n=1 Tax=Amycolatopsis thermalba TaxID=944492 RepID=A0ABY4NZ10_9PSEU|nr:glycerate kinase [Amycolatopsis thermalba]UQS25329.1 glycerate kinase [Amycolatopsis thermalba]